MPKFLALFGGLLILACKVFADGNVHEEVGPSGVFGGYGDYGSYRGYTGPVGTFNLGHNGFRQGFGYGNTGFGLGSPAHGYGGVRGGLGSFGHGVGYGSGKHDFASFGHGLAYGNTGLGVGNYGPGATVHHTGATYYPSNIGYAGGFYGDRGIAQVSPQFYESPVGYGGFGVGYDYAGYGPGINNDFNSHGGYSGYGNLGISPHYGYGFGIPYGYANGYGHHQQTGGIIQSTELAKSGYTDNDGRYANEHGGKGQISQRVGEGLSSEHLAEKKAKGGSGYYANAGGAENNHEDAKFYQGADHYDQSVNRGEEDKNALAHRKGYATKGFETSHHKDETGKTTTFFDEGGNQGNRFNYGGQHKSAGDSRVNSYHGGLQDNNFRSGKHGDRGEYDQGFLTDQENANKFAYGNQVRYGSNDEYGGTGGTGSHSVGGFSKFNQFIQQRPYFYH